MTSATDDDPASATEARARLAAGPDGRFGEHELTGLPDVVARYFRASIARGAPLVPAASLQMRGRIKVGRWLPFTAREALHPHRGFVWSARVAGSLIVGSDRYLGGVGGMQWRLLGLVPVLRAGGADLARSAAARAGAESLWVPVATLPRYGARWEADDDRTVTVRFAVDDTPMAIRYHLDGEGRVRRGVFDRWGDPDGTGRWGWYRCGGEVTAYRTFGDLTVPSAGRMGWHAGTARWPDGEFFRYEITALTPLPRPDWAP